MEIFLSMANTLDYYKMARLHNTAEIHYAIEKALAPDLHSYGRYSGWCMSKRLACLLSLNREKVVERLRAENAGKFDDNVPF